MVTLASSLSPAASWALSGSGRSRPEPQRDRSGGGDCFQHVPQAQRHFGMPGTEPEPHRGQRLRCRGGTQPDRERVSGNTYCKHLKRQHLNICIARTPTAPDEYFCSVMWVALKTPGLFVFFGPTNARERRRGFFACFVEVRRCLSRAKQVLSRRSRTGCGPGA